ncbi:hypothetical protein [Candidatus Nitrosocosmicus arcticus]|nr:hypothetical protein [Candidatus Nitrosocosmicus arcticus]
MKALTVVLAGGGRSWEELGGGGVKQKSTKPGTVSKSNYFE